MQSIQTLVMDGSRLVEKVISSLMCEIYSGLAFFYVTVYLHLEIDHTKL